MSTGKITIDIGKKFKSSYNEPAIPCYYKDGQSRNIGKTEHIAGGYKDYTLSLKDLSNEKTQIDIERNGTKQNFSTIFSTCEKITVSYLLEDETNAVPLLVQLCKSNGITEIYVPNGQNSWRKHITSTGNDIPKNLSSVIHSLLTCPVVIFLDTNKDYYITGFPSNSLNLPRINITDDSSRSYNCYYKRFKHSYYGGQKIRVVSIRHNNSPIEFDKGVLENEYVHVIVSYWTGDRTYKNPLILELGIMHTSGHKSNVYYAPIGDHWRDSGYLHHRLMDEQSRQNCNQNNAHVIDTSKKVSTIYSCLSCRVCNIHTTYINETNYQYGSVTHEMKEGNDHNKHLDRKGVIDYNNYVGSFQNRDHIQLGLFVTDKTSKVTTYWYKDDSYPSLIYIHSPIDKWYRITKDYTSLWHRVTSTLNKDDKKAIYEKLVSISKGEDEQPITEEEKEILDELERDEESTEESEDEYTHEDKHNTYDDTARKEKDKPKRKPKKSYSYSGISTVGIVAGVVVAGLCIGMIGRMVWNRYSPRMYHVFHNVVLPSYL
ncbi:hypothetical protein BEWA_033030 [Theileria equi strain WA]|uniref:Uncharacterized protein n=1 Tax=Theileria equi strain WA TaxID=1537102 RepID=L0AY19_THEEQ|nr:hypothetical protein BEWA_033030 [Theileria equi strain WA]AFZ80450.1 hypothetical protein BEWA_033030 [Theileria equi strain WA]|eukprot:XP_004830116.1 hypothetical protein BEWA_033030 [Theileria equi strain WA]